MERSGFANRSYSRWVALLRSAPSKDTFAARLGEGFQNEAAGGIQRQVVVLLVKRVVEKARIDVHLLDRRTQPLEKLALNIPDPPPNPPRRSAPRSAR
jgi:hypothetical protein